MCTGRKIFVCVSCFTRATGIYIYIYVVFLEVVSLCHPEGRHGGREGEGRGVVYSYVTEDEEEMNEPAAEPAPPRTEATALRTDSTAPRARPGPPGCAAKSAATPGRRAGRSQDSSSDRERGRRRPPSPASPVRVDRSPRRSVAPARPTRSVPPARLDEPLPDTASRRPPAGESGGVRGKGKGSSGYGRRYQSCPHCWHDVAVTPRGSGLSQHMWTVHCMATLFNIPKGTYAQWRAQEIKDRRETEWEAPEAVFPARSAAHRHRLEDLQREEELMQDEGEDDVRKSDDTKNKKKKKKKRRRRHHGSDPSPHRSRKRDCRPPSSDRSDGGGHKAKRRGEESKDMVWVQVPRASLAK